MGEMTITFKISSFDFTFIWSQYTKKGGNFNEFLIDYYIEEIAERFPGADKVIPKIFLTQEDRLSQGDRLSLARLLCGAFSGGYPDRPYSRQNPNLSGMRDADKLIENFFVAGDKIKNPIEVGI